MCGLVTIFSYKQDAPPISQGELLRIRDHMAARGPDDSGMWISDDRTVGLAHRRLNIIDLTEAGSQPMISADGNVIICFNGEIYNYKKLRADLERRGSRFKSSSDTEVLLHLYEKKGMEMVNDLRGMYAFALWDNRKKSLALVRDPFGIKPLYIADDGKTLRVASQVKALLAGRAINTTVNPAGHVGFFMWGHIPEPHTLYKEIISLSPGTVFEINSEGKRKEWSFCDLSLEIAGISQNIKELDSNMAQAHLKNALVDSIRHHLIADVPVGIFLSSGIDSTTITALASELNFDLRTVTLGFEEYRGTQEDEAPLAEKVARQYGAKHQTIWLKKEEFQAEYMRLLAAMDQPTVDGINTYFVSYAARKSGLKVALSGLGGDELFGSYPSFRQIPKITKTCKVISKVPGLGRVIRQLSAPIVSRMTSPKFASICEYGGSYGGAYLLRRGLFMPWELSDFLDSDMVVDGCRELQTMENLEQTISDVKGDFYKICTLEMIWYMRNQLLRDTDWASMANSLEIRLPLLDLKLFREVTTLISSFDMPGKQAMGRTPLNVLPDAVLGRPKTGFSVPVKQWVSREGKNGERGLRGWARRVYKEFVQ